MTRRRALLRVIGTVIGGGGAVGLAGCVSDEEPADDSGDDDSGNGDDGLPDEDGETDDDDNEGTDEGDDGTTDDDNEGTDEGDDGTTDDTDNIDEEQAREDYEEAIANLVANEDALATARDEESLEQTDIEELETRLDDARTLLEDAESNAPADLREQIEAARDVAGFQALVIQAEHLAIKANAALAEADQLSNAEQYEEAANAYQHTLDLLDEQQTLLEEIRSAHAGLETDPLDEPALDYRDDLISYIGLEDEALLDEVMVFVEGRRDLAQGWVHLEAGNEEWHDNNDAEAAKAEWEAGRSVALAASENFETVAESSVEGDLAGAAEFFQFVAGVQWETLDRLVAAAETAIGGDIDQAIQEYEEAMTYLDGQLQDL